MDIAAGWLVLLVGAAFLYASLALTVRANRGTRIPQWRNPGRSPAGTIALRAAGSGLIVLGAVLLGSTVGWWAAVVAIALLIPVPVVIVVHNRRVAQARGPGA